MNRVGKIFNIVFIVLVLIYPAFSFAKAQAKGIDDIVYLTIKNQTNYHLYSLWGPEIPPHSYTVLRFDYSHAFTMVKSMDQQGYMDGCEIDINFDIEPARIHLLPRLHRNLMTCNFGPSTNEIIFSARA